KELGDKGKTITDADLRAIIDQVKGEEGKKYIVLGDLLAVSGNKIIPTASVSAKVNGKEIMEAATGDGPVDAAIKALERIVGELDVSLEEYHVDAVTGGSDATVSVMVKVKSGDRVATASGVHSDIIMASVMAMINGINTILRQ
ncbi:MAG: 2-isopropylmalate synthase, partial [Candidatus Altiarchaeota archaeon]|nr:2-isopropylmalate synthase [Candidatus Altiarchaeota archaeon]